MLKDMTMIHFLKGKYLFGGNFKLRVYMFPDEFHIVEIGDDTVADRISKFQKAFLFIL